MQDEVQAKLIGYNNEIKSGIAQVQRQLTLMADKDVDKVIKDLAILKVDQDYLQQEVVPRLQQNEVGLRTRIEQQEKDVINMRAQLTYKLQQLEVEVNKKLAEVELQVQKTIIDATKKHVQALKVVKEEMLAVQ